MVARRFRPITLVTVKKVHGALDDKEVPSFQTVMAHVTEVNGAQLQNDLFGKQYTMTWVARVRGNVSAKYVFYPRLGVEDKYVNKRSYLTVILPFFNEVRYFLNHIVGFAINSSAHLNVSISSHAPQLRASIAEPVLI